MPTFEFTAITTSGERIRGEVASPSEQAALGELETRRLTPVTIRAKGDPVVRARAVSARKLGTAYRQVSELLHAGVPLLRALRLLAGRKSQPRLAAVFGELAERVAAGEDLGAAMGTRPDVFPPVHVAMVKAGEKGGFLEPVLARLGQLVLRQADLRGTVIGNLIYPGVLVGLGCVILGVVFGVFVPKFRPIFQKLEDEGGLPLATKLVFAISDAVGAYGVVTALVVVGLGVAAWRAARRPVVREAIDRARTRAPVIGPLTRSLAAARFCRMLGTMLASGVPMLSAMQIAREAAGNRLMEEAIREATESVRGGASLALPLGRSGLFEEDVIEMISVAEAANNLEQVLTNIAETIEQRVDRMLTVSVRLIEPLLILCLAGVVVIVAVALILPMTRMSANL